jgi:predicted Co/Zn/Cd cation transporter (cation efflux family)
MAICGVLTAWLANADALLVDGLYSGVNFLASLVAARVGQSVMRPWDKNRPFGYYADEAIYITFRAIILLGILIFAAFSAITKIMAYASGREVAELSFGLITLYSIVMVVTCLGLAYVHHQNWLKTRKSSDILKAEKQSAVIDGAMSAGVGIAFGLAPFLEATPLGVILPVIDSIIVLILTVVIIKQPISLFLGALAEIAGESAPPSIVETVEATVNQLVRPEGYDVIQVGVSKLGRFHLILVYLNPHAPVTAPEIDQLRSRMTAVCTEAIGLVVLEVVLTENSRLASA